MHSSDVSQVCEKAWSLTALALIDDGVPARIAPLAAAAGVSRSAMTPSVNHLIALGLLAENTGHGHPLRPALVLTESGRQWARLARGLSVNTRSASEKKLCRLTWTLPVLMCVEKPARFSQIKSSLISISDRALALSLTQLQTHGWVDRSVFSDSRPPSTVYEASGAGAKLANLLIRSHVVAVNR